MEIRLRVLSICALSVAAFHSVAGAVMVMLWWGVFSRRLRSLPSLKAVASVFLLLIVAALAAELTTGGGASYLVRMTAVFLIAFWAYGERVPGELIRFGVSVFGRRAGFDLGLAGEMGMEALDSLRDDIAQIRAALRLKGKRLGPGTIAGFGISVIHAHIRHSDERAALLAIRGYLGGGTACPDREDGKGGAMAAILAVFIVILSFVPLGDVFI
ncbi:hypothetical protein [Methanofollis fontis]|uniref:Energy-coupling factor transporter transmembrane protein EcfT n=1 Tax=Methanofollis fontis TaxID=2052832 RepID=A0A483CSC1_9EURY|nr:hypothetical protein [Methanofollis fontis]TAJ43985.1 hypothetical protein CUJ86_08040 [Methanofollis fontis]